MLESLSKLLGFSRRTKDRKLAKSHQDNDASLNASRKSSPAISTIVEESFLSELPLQTLKGEICRTDDEVNQWKDLIENECK
jgi:hypothetical protein